jgi:predicted PurR-regulated permease PerM
VIVLAYGALVVGTLDNILRPILTGRGINVHPLLVFLALFGGILAFGPAGIFLGPLFVSLFIALAHIYEREMSPNATSPAGERVPDSSLSGRLKGMVARLIFKRPPEP